MTIPTLDAIPAVLLEAAPMAAAWMLTYALHSTLLLGAAWLLGRRLGNRRLGLQEGAWKTALVGGLVTASLQLALTAGPVLPGTDGFEPLAGRWALAGPAATAAEAVPEAAARGTEAAAAQPTAYGQVPGAGTGRPGPARPAAAQGSGPATAPAPAAAASGAVVPLGAMASPGTADPGSAGPATDTATDTATDPATGPWWPLAAVAVWMLVGTGLLLTLALSYTHLAWRLRHRRPVREGALPALFGRLLERALDRPTGDTRTGSAAPRRRSPARRLAGARLTRSAWLPVPIAWGVLRPEVSVPPRVVDRLSPYHQESILAHELSHLLRRDPAWLAVARGIEAVCFFQPLNRLARRRLQEIAEYRADDQAVALTGRPLELARCLTEVAAWRVAGGLPVPTLPVPGMASDGSGLGRRVRRLLEAGTPGSGGGGAHRAPRGLAAVSAAVLLLVVLMAPAVTGTATTTAVEAGGDPPTVEPGADPASPSSRQPGDPSADRPGTPDDVGSRDLPSTGARASAWAVDSAARPGPAPAIALPAVPPVEVAPAPRGLPHGPRLPHGLAPAGGAVPAADVAPAAPWTVSAAAHPGDGGPSGEASAGNAELRDEERELRREVERLRRELAALHREHAAARAELRDQVREEEAAQREALRRERGAARAELEQRSHEELAAHREALREEQRAQEEILRRELERVRAEAESRLPDLERLRRDAEEGHQQELVRRELERALRDALSDLEATGAGHRESLESVRRELEAQQRRALERAELEALRGRLAAGPGSDAAEEVLRREMEARREALRAERERLAAMTAGEAEGAAALAREVEMQRTEVAEVERAEMERAAEELRRAAAEAVAAGRLDEAEALATEADHLARRGELVGAELARARELHRKRQERARVERQRVLEALERKLEEQLQLLEAREAEAADVPPAP